MDCHTGCSSQFGAEHGHAVGGWRGWITHNQIRHTTKPNRIRAVHEPSLGGRWEKFCLQTGAHPTPCSAPAPCHQPDLMPVCSSTEKTRNSEPQLQPDRLQEGSRPLDPCEKCLLVSNPGFTLMLFSAKELKNHVIYTYTSVSIENVCTSGKMALPTRWGLFS